MKNVILSESDRTAVESIVYKIAASGGINDFEDINIYLDNESGFLRFKSSGADLGTIGAGILGLMIGGPAGAVVGPGLELLIGGMNSDPDIDAIVNQIVDAEISKESSSLFGVDKPKYVQMIKGMVTEGARKIVEQFQQQNKQNQQQPAQTTVPPPAQMQLASIHMEQREKTAILDVIGNLAIDAASKLVDSLGNFFRKPESAQLVQQLVSASVQKGYIPRGYEAQFTEYLNKFIQAGFQEAQQEVEQKKEQENQQQQGDKQNQNGVISQKNVQNVNSPGDAAQIEGPTESSPSYNPEVSGLAPLTPIEAPRQPGTLNFAEQSNIDREKTASDYMEDLSNYDPVSYEIVEEFLIRGGYTKTDKDRYNGIDKFAGFAQDIINTIGKMKNVATPDNIDKVRSFIQKNKEYAPLLKHLGINKPEDFINNADEILKNLSSTITSISTMFNSFNKEESPGKEKAETEKKEEPKKTEDESKPEKEEETAINKLDALPINDEEASDINEILSMIDSQGDEPDITKLNSEYFLINKGGNLFLELETALKKIAQDNSISDVNEIKVEVTKDSGEVVFRRKKAIDLVSGFAAGLAGRMLGGEESWGTTGLKALEASITNLGAPIGQAIAKYMGFGTMGQLVAGGLSAYAWYLLFNQDTPNGKAAMNGAYSSIISDEKQKQIIDGYKSMFPNLSEETIMKIYLKSISRLSS